MFTEYNESDCNVKSFTLHYRYKLDIHQLPTTVNHDQHAHDSAVLLSVIQQNSVTQNKQ
jgi:hypothetical protein